MKLKILTFREVRVFLPLLIAAIGLALSAGGAAQQYIGGKKVEKAQERAEKAREDAANLDARRRQRALIRESAIARANSEATATAQGAGQGSALPGAFAGISGQTGNAVAGVAQNLELGQEIFTANRQQRQGQTQVNQGQAITSVGQTLVGQRNEISAIGTYFGH